jgi:hypothetical protein
MRAGESHPAWRPIFQVYDSFMRGDEAAINAVFDRQCTIWDVFEPELIRGRAEQDAFHERDRAQLLTRGKLTLDVKPVQLDVQGAVAWARYYVDFEYAPPNAAAGRVRVTDVLKLTQGEWIILHHHEGLSPAGPP